MARLPQPGGDIGEWGSILNEYLSVIHKSDGSLKNNSIPEAALASTVQAKLNAVAGPAGPTGPTGAPGVTGPKGDKGDQGDPGPASATEGFVITADSTGVADATTAFQSALDDHAVVLIPAGTYRVGKVTHTGSSRTIKALGPVTIIQTDASGVFELKGGWDYLGTVASFATTRTNLVTAGESAPASSDTWVSVLTMNSAVTVTKSDILKVVSDDINTYARPSHNNRLGEYSLAGLDSSGTTVTLSNILIEPYATNIRLARLQDCTYVITGDITFDTDPAIRDTTVFGAVVNFRSGKYNRIDGGVKFYNSIGRAIGNSSYCSTFDGIIFRNLANRPTKSQYGYGVQDNGWQTVMTRCHGENLRHLYSEGAGTISGTNNNTDFDYFGGGWFARVSDCTGINCQSQVFDTHGSAYGVTFSDCHAFGSYIGASSGGSGFVSRGRNTVFRDCLADSCFVGFGVTGSYTKVINCTVRRAYYQALQIRGDSDDGTNITTIKGIVVEGGSFEVIDNRIAVAMGSNGYNMTIRLRNVTGRMLAGASPSRAFDLSGSGTLLVYMDGCVADFEDFTTTSTPVTGILLGTDAATLRANQFKFQGGSGAMNATVLMNSNGAGAGNAADAELIGYDYEHASLSPTIAGSGMTKKRYSGKARFGTAWYQVTSSALVIITATSSVSLATIAERADPTITVKFTGSNGAITTGNLPVFSGGMRSGTVVKFYNASNGIVTIPSSSTAPSAATNIGVDEYVEFTYHGDYWRRSV